MRTLVTGGAGFIGSTLVDRLLAEGHSVDVVDNLSTSSLSNLSSARSSGGDFRFHQLDVRDRELLDLFDLRKPEVVFHLAAQTSIASSISDPFTDAELNVLGGLRVFEGARACGARKVVYAASGGTLYGRVSGSEFPIDEHRARRPDSPYGLSKKVLIDYLEIYREFYGLEFTALALSNVYGPRQDPRYNSGVVAAFVTNLLNGRRCVIDGDGTQVRDLVYVDDVVDAFSRAGQRGSGLVLHISSGTETSMNELYDTIREVIGSDLVADHRRSARTEAQRGALDPSRAKIHLGWRPWTTLRQGITNVVNSPSTAVAK